MLSHFKTYMDDRTKIDRFLYHSTLLAKDLEEDAKQRKAAAAQKQSSPYRSYPKPRKSRR